MDLLPELFFFESTKGILYVGYEELGPGIYDRDQDEFKRLIINGKTIITNTSVKGLIEDKDGNLWAATKEAVYIATNNFWEAGYHPAFPYTPHSGSFLYQVKSRMFL